MIDQFNAICRKNKNKKNNKNYKINKKIQFILQMMNLIKLWNLIIFKLAKIFTKNQLQESNHKEIVKIWIKTIKKKQLNKQ